MMPTINLREKKPAEQCQIKKPVLRRRKVKAFTVAFFGAVLILTSCISTFSDAATPPSSSSRDNGRRRVRGTAKVRLKSRTFNLTPTTSTTTTTFSLDDESKRLLRLESASPLAYLYRYRPAKVTHTPQPPSSPPFILSSTTIPPSEAPSKAHNPRNGRKSGQPRVLLRSTGQSGVIRRRKGKVENVNVPSSPPSPLEPSGKIDQADYPYHVHLDYQEAEASGRNNNNNEFLHLQPSIHGRPLPQHQSAIWNEFIQEEVLQPHGSTTTSRPPMAIMPPLSTTSAHHLYESEQFNEINDNFTIPSLRGFRFPEYKPTSDKPLPQFSNNGKDFLNPYDFFSEEELDNVADLAFVGDHSKYFVKTKPRDVSSSVTNFYNSFYYEPPSFSTKIQPLPVKAKFPHSKTEEDHASYNADKRRLKWNSNKEEYPQHDYRSGFDYGTEPVVTYPMTLPPTTASTFTTPGTTPTVSSNPNNLVFPTLQSYNPATYFNTAPMMTNLSSFPQIPLLLPQQQHQSQMQYFYRHITPSQPKTSESYGQSQTDPATAESLAILSSAKSHYSLNSVIPPSIKPLENDHYKQKFSTVPTLPTFTTTTPSTPLFTFTTPVSTTVSDTTNIPGMPGIDYPIFDEIPSTGFDCEKQRYKGFFADIETKCQVWHYCDFGDSQASFLCPNGTLFSQVLLTCDWWFNVDCNQAQQLYVLNERLYRYIKPPKPSFPEDYHGPQVDLWLKKQLELGLLPKIKKRGKLTEKLEKVVPTTLKEKVANVTSHHQESNLAEYESAPTSSSSEDDKTMNNSTSLLPTATNVSSHLDFNYK